MNLKLAVRQILKLKIFSMINLGVLSILLAAGIIILVYASWERSFDRHIPGYDNKYRIITTLGNGQYWARTFACFPDALSDRPEIESITSFVYSANNRIKIGESEFTISEAVIADTAFTDFFGVDIIAGRKEDLGEPNTVFLSTGTADLLFPQGDALGKEIFLKQMEGNTNDSLGIFTVRGIVKTLPENTHFGFRMIYSQTGNFSGLMNHLKENKVYGANVYVRIPSRDQAQELEKILESKLQPILSGGFGPPVEAFNSKLQPVGDIHFTTNINREARPATRKSALYVLFTVGTLILILMCINFLSLLTVQSLKQRKDTGIMKTLGADRSAVFRLSLIKVLLLTGSSVLLSWIIIVLSAGKLEYFFKSGWEPWDLKWIILRFSLAVTFLVSIIAAWAMHISGTGKLLSGKKLYRILEAWIIIQCGIVVFLIAFSLMIDKQLNYMNSSDLGYDPENVLIVRIPSQQPRGSLLVEQLRGYSGIVHASTAHHHPGDVFQHLDLTTANKEYPFEFRMMDQDAFETLDIKILKNFGSEGSKMNGWVINETFYKHLLQDYSEEDIAGSNFSLPDEGHDDSKRRFIVAGVMSDFHYSSLHDRIGNFAFVIRNPESLYNRWLMIRFSEGQYEKCFGTVKELMESHFPGRPLEAFLLSENLETRYASSKKLSRIILVFSILSIIISAFGLYGLSAYIAGERTKEIGIRKVFGASTRQILRLLNLGIVKLAVIAFAIACPVSVWILKKWLMNFAYRSTPSAWIFILTGIIVIGVTLLSVSWQTTKAAGMQPVDSIRHE